MSAPSDYDQLPGLDEEVLTSSLERTRAQVRIRQFSLEVTGGPDSGKRLISKGSSVVIGSARSAAWQLSDRSVSRFHCELTVTTDGRVRVEDLNSRNGTRVNEVWVREVWLDQEVTLRLGANTVLFRLAPTEHPLEVSTATRFGDLVGQSVPMRSLFAEMETVAGADATTLIAGETGTGKELVADALHRFGPRSARPFVIVDCGALPADMIQSELFGHVRGAFTGATRDRVGAFEAAHTGTVFLDEIGELPIDLQSQLLRVLEQKTIRRVGSNDSIPVDVRVVAATHRDLRRAVNAKQFRSDLYYRLAVMELRIPPLRERISDLPLLIEHIGKDIGLGPARRMELQSAESVRLMAAHGWPGNVRELRNYLQRATFQSRPLTAKQENRLSSITVDLDVPLKEHKEALITALEREYVMKTLQRANGNIAEAARQAGVSRMQLYRLMQKHEIESA